MVGAELVCEALSMEVDVRDGEPGLFVESEAERVGGLGAFGGPVGEVVQAVEYLRIALVVEGGADSETAWWLMSASSAFRTSYWYW